MLRFSLFLLVVAFVAVHGIEHFEQNPRKYVEQRLRSSPKEKGIVSSDRGQEQRGKEDVQHERDHKYEEGHPHHHEHVHENLDLMTIDDSYLRKVLEYERKSPSYKADLECFKKVLSKDAAVDFVIDLAPSPSKDELDKYSASAPMPFRFDDFSRSPSRTYFSVIQMFIDTVTLGMNPDVTHSVIYSDKNKYHICGRSFDDVDSVKKLSSGGDFEDRQRNLLTLFPVGTKEQFSRLPEIKNSLGRSTKLALWARDNGLPIVLNSDRRSKPIYSVVITDGWSGAKIHDLVDDLSRTTVIDIGSRRFAKNIEWDEMKQLMGVYTLPAPQETLALADTIRRKICLASERHGQQMSDVTF